MVNPLKTQTCCSRHFFTYVKHFCLINEVYHRQVSLCSLSLTKCFLLQPEVYTIMLNTFYVQQMRLPHKMKLKKLVISNVFIMLLISQLLKEGERSLLVICNGRYQSAFPGDYWIHRKELLKMDDLCPQTTYFAYFHICLFAQFHILVCFIEWLRREKLLATTLFGHPLYVLLKGT